MKKLISFAFAALLAVGAFAQTVAVLGFESDNFCIEERTGMMSDLLTDELVGLPHITVVERKHIDKVVGEMKFQAKPYTDPATAKSLGKMIGADCVIVGSADVFAGTWTGTVQTDSYADEYEITFEKKGKCTVKVTPDGNFGSPLTARGTWSDSDDILHINARFKTDIARLKTMNWAAVYALGDDGESFSMNIRGEGDKLVRVVFAKME